MDALYKADFHLWTKRQAQYLRTMDFDLLDSKNLIAEMLDMAEQEQAALKRHLEKLMRCLLRCKLQPERVSGQWLSTILKQRYRIHYALDEMPSIRPLFDGWLEESYQKAAHRASVKTKLPRAFFPATLPFTKQQLLDKDFIP
jgi:hypothetical protein